MSLLDTSSPDGSGFRIPIGDYSSFGTPAFDAGNSSGTPTYFPNDARETAALAPYNANPSNGLTTLENAIAYGFTRVIDNTFVQPQIYGNVYPGSGAGNNGRTYQQLGANRNAVLGQPGTVAGIPTSFLLIGAAVLALLILRR